MKKNEKLTRREFFRTCGRLAVTGGMAAFAAMMWKRKESKLPGQICSNRGICRSCSDFEKCKLPQALSAKKVVNE